MSISICQSAAVIWAKVTANIRAQARDTYGRDLTLHQRLQYVQMYLLSKAWYTVQVLPPKDSIKRINMAVSWYIWRVETFRVPLSTLVKRKKQGGWELTHVAAKCRALRMHRLQTQGRTHGSLTATWLAKWDLLSPSINPPHMNRIPLKRERGMDSAYIPPQWPTESRKVYRKRICNVLLTLTQAEATLLTPRVKR